MTAAAAAAGCPKRMTYGPCGGVREHGGCEVDDRPCPFAAAGPVAYAGPVPERGVALNARATALRERLAAGGVVIGDFPARAMDAVSLRRCAGILGDLDAVLLGDAPQERVQFPPAYRAALVQAAGLTACVGLNARDRNRVALEGELAALADLGAGGVLCLTGDHPALGHRPDAGAVFDVDSTQLAAMAAGRGLVVAVAEAPAAPPRALRPARLVAKERAGGEVCMIDHCGGEAAVHSFVAAARELGSTASMLACVPLVCDAGSAAALASFEPPAAERDLLQRVAAAADPRAEGVAAAVAFGRRLLDTGVLAGVDLSGGPGAGDEVAYADAMAEVAAELRH